MSNKTVVNFSFPVFGLVGLCLVIAKLGGIDPIANWSWWLVTIPFWIGIAIWLAAIIFFLLVAIFAALCGAVISAFDR